MQAHGVHVEAIIDARVRRTRHRQRRRAGAGRRSGHQCGRRQARHEGDRDRPGPRPRNTSPASRWPCPAAGARWCTWPATRGSRPSWDEDRHCFMPPQDNPGIIAAGSANGGLVAERMSGRWRGGAANRLRGKPGFKTSQNALYRKPGTSPRFRHATGVVGETVHRQAVCRLPERRDGQGPAAGGARGL